VDGSAAGDGDGGRDVTGTQAVHSGWIEELGAPRAEPAREGTPPSADDLRRILETATTVPDHGGLRPWRFAVVTESGRQQLGDALVAGLHELRGSDLPAAMVEKMRKKAYAAPCTVAVIASPDPGSNVPVWEQVASASCTGYALVLGAVALGFGAVWKSAAVLETPPVRRLFDLGDDEDLLGWVNIGSPAPMKERRAGRGFEAVDLDELVTVLGDGPDPLR
jgi:nitroreductase